MELVRNQAGFLQLATVRRNPLKNICGTNIQSGVNNPEAEEKRIAALKEATKNAVRFLDDLKSLVEFDGRHIHPSEGFVAMQVKRAERLKELNLDF